MDEKVYAQGLSYKSCWILVIADSSYFAPTVLTSDGTLLSNGRRYVTVEEAIVAGRKIVDMRARKAVDDDDIRWID